MRATDHPGGPGPLCAIAHSLAVPRAVLASGSTENETVARAMAAANARKWGSIVRASDEAYEEGT